MPDIDPSALSRPSISIGTPTLSSKALSATGGLSKPKSSQIIPTRIDLEPYYAAIKTEIPSEKWTLYKETVANLAYGRLNQSEFSAIIDPLIQSPNGEKVHHHNRLIMAMIANVSREVPDPGQAAWVSANDKPTAPQGSKPVTGDAAERLLKGGVMQLPARDRRRIKDLSHNDFDPQQELANVFSDIRRKPAPAPELAQSATGVMSNMNFDIEIRKRYNAPLAIESGEFPDSNVVSGRMLPLCYEAGLASGHSPEAPQLLTVAVETFIKENLATIFSRTRCNGPGDAGNAGFGVGINWIQTAQYAKQLHLEENLAQNGRLTRDKNGLLPVEAKAASERGPLTVADLRLAIEVGETGFSHFPALRTQILQGYREGELENYNEYSYVSGHETTDQVDEYVPALVNGEADAPVLNGMGEPMDVDTTLEWEGAEEGDIDLLDNVLDQILVGT